MRTFRVINPFSIMKHLTTIIVILLVLGGGIFLWYQYGKESEPIETSDPILEKTINELRRLKTIALDTSLFEDPLFLSLTVSALEPAAGETASTTSVSENSALPLPDTYGRPNPFLPF